MHSTELEFHFNYHCAGTWQYTMPKTAKKKTKSTTRPSVPYVRGFHPPTAKKCLEAIGSTCLDKAYTPSDNFFPPLPHPTSIDDWLAQYKEPGQTYKLFLEECPWLSQRKRKYSKAVFNPSGNNLQEKYPDAKIYLLPLGEFDGVATPRFSDLAEYARLFFCLPVEILPPVKLTTEGKSIFWEETNDGKGKSSKPEAATRRRSSRPSKYELESRFNATTGHTQLKVESILRKLRQCIPDNAVCVMALTMADLFDTLPDLFVAGMAAGNQRVGVFSFCRYDPTLQFSSEFWYEIFQATSVGEEERRRLILQRSCKLLVHEIAHLLGIDHCIWYSCCMNGSGHLQEDFRQSMHLCPVDLRKLQTLCGFDMVARYRGLMAFFERHSLNEEGGWVKRRVAYITEKEL